MPPVGRSASNKRHQERCAQPFWDAHACLPLARSASLDELSHHRHAGCRAVAINVGFDGIPPQATIATLERLAAQLDSADGTFSDVAVVANQTNDTTSLGVYFDIEGADVLCGDLRGLERLAQLGVRSMLPVYNRANIAGGGCYDPSHYGLTRFGRELIGRQNELGIIVDASHCSLGTTLDMCEISQRPVIFSHSNCGAITNHPRNISDDQIRAAAATGGVVGINGASAFLGNDDWPVAICAHILHVIQVAGIDHVGIGLDYVYDLDDLGSLIANTPLLFPDETCAPLTRSSFCPPEQWPKVEHQLSLSGLDEAALEKVRWANFARVARETFRGTAILPGSVLDRRSG
jgi:membrane dipeptidase